MMMLLLLTLGVTYRLRDRFALTRIKGRVLCFRIQGANAFYELEQQHIRQFRFPLANIASTSCRSILCFYTEYNNQTLFADKHWCSEGVNHLEVVWKLARTHTQLHRPHMFISSVLCRFCRLLAMAGSYGYHKT